MLGFWQRQRAASRGEKQKDKLAGGKRSSLSVACVLFLACKGEKSSGESSMSQTLSLLPTANVARGGVKNQSMNFGGPGGWAHTQTIALSFSFDKGDNKKMWPNLKATSKRFLKRLVHPWFESPCTLAHRHRTLEQKAGSSAPWYSPQSPQILRISPAFLVTRNF